MRKFVAIFVAWMALVSCQKAYVSRIELAVDSETLKLPSCEAGYFYMHVASNRDWTLSVESEKDWLHPEQTSGTGPGYPRFTYDAYVGAVEREAAVILSGGGKTIRVRVIQPKSE